MYYLDEENFSLIREIDYLIDLATKYYYYYYCAKLRSEFEKRTTFCINKRNKDSLFLSEKKIRLILLHLLTTILL